jgi:hypothetical protein
VGPCEERETPRVNRNRVSCNRAFTLGSLDETLIAHCSKLACSRLGMCRMEIWSTEDCLGVGARLGAAEEEAAAAVANSHETDDLS